MKESRYEFFVFIALIITASLGIIAGIAQLFPDQVFGHYLFIIVAGMMIYSYLTYAGICSDEKNWIMFTVSILVIIFTTVLTILLVNYLIQGL